MSHAKYGCYKLGGYGIFIFIFSTRPTSLSGHLITSIRDCMYIDLSERLIIPIKQPPDTCTSNQPRLVCPMPRSRIEDF